MNENRVKRILREGGLALGTHVGGIPDPQIVEIIGLAGFDAAFIDMEHTSFDLHDVQAMVMAAERVGITPIVRTPGFDPAFVLRLLDMGVQGIQVPHVHNAETARAAVKAVRYPPQGERGMAAGSRAAEFGHIPLARAHGAVEPRDPARLHDRGHGSRRAHRRDRRGRGRRPPGGGSFGSVAFDRGQRPARPSATGGGDRPGARGGEKSAGAGLALPLNHAAFPRNAAQLKALGVGYTNCAPTPEARLLKSLREQADEARRLLG